MRRGLSLWRRGDGLPEIARVSNRIVPMLLLRACFLSVALLGGVACSSSGTGPQGQGPASLTLSAPRTSLVPGLATQLAWVVKDRNGQVLPDAPVTFTLAPSGVASVSSDGVVLGVTSGTATLTGRAGTASAQLAITVQPGGLVDATGAVLSAFNGVVQLEVPAGAVASPTAIAFGTTPNPLLDPTAVRGNVYTVAIEAPGLTVPATLRLRISTGNGPFGLPAEAYRVRAFDGAAWVGVAGSTSNPATLTTSAAIAAGGTFSAGWAPPEAPCVAPEHRQFDFWLGGWQVTAGGQPNGQSDITAAPGGCAVFEHYRTLGGGTGRSISFYQPVTQKWYQTYLDNAGYLLQVSGSFEGGAMRLFTAPVGAVLERWSWIIEGEAVRQLAERSNNGGTSYLPPSWNGLYTRR